MDEHTAEKFASLFAGCAITGCSDELRKEAADQQLIKEAINPWLIAGPLAGTLAGGAAGYFGTEDEKRKKRNALYGALSGGLLGLGVPLMSAASELTGANLNTTDDKKTNTDTAAPAGDKKSPFTFAGAPPDQSDPRHYYPYANYNNIPARIGGGVVGYAAGRGIGSGVGSALDSRAYLNSIPVRSATLDSVLNPPRAKGQKPPPDAEGRRWISDLVKRIQTDAADPSRLGALPKSTSWSQWLGNQVAKADMALDMVRPAWGGTLARFRRAAGQELLYRPYQGGGTPPPIVSAKRDAVSALARLAQDSAAPVKPKELHRLITALETARAAGRRGVANTAGGSTPPALPTRENLFTGLDRAAVRRTAARAGAPPRPTWRGRTAGRAGGLSGAIGGSYLMSPEMSERALNALSTWLGYGPAAPEQKTE